MNKTRYLPPDPRIIQRENVKQGKPRLTAEQKREKYISPRDVLILTIKIIDYLVIDLILAHWVVSLPFGSTDLCSELSSNSQSSQIITSGGSICSSFLS